VLQYTSRWPRTDPQCVSSTPVNPHLSPTMMTPLLQSNAQQSVAYSHSTNYKLWRNHEVWSYRSGEYYVYIFLQSDSMYFGRQSPTLLKDTFYTHIRSKIFNSVDNVLDGPSFESGQGDWLLWPSIFCSIPEFHKYNPKIGHDCFLGIKLDKCNSRLLSFDDTLI